MKLAFTSPSYEVDSPVRSVALGLLFAGLLCIPLAESLGPSQMRITLYNIMILATLSSVTSLALEDRRPRFSRALLLVEISLIAQLAAAWLTLPGLLALLVVPVLLAMLMYEPPGIFLVAGLELASLSIYPLLLPGQYSLLELVAGAIPIVCAAGVLWMNHRRTSEMWRWSSEYLRKAQEFNLETRDRSQELEKALQNLSSANQLLVQANHRGDRLRALAEKAEKTKAMFVARVSHEFRTPLNMIIGLVELMVEAPQIYAIHMPPELEKDLEVVLRNCRHLSNMIDDVLELTRAESGSLPLHRGWVSLAEIAGEAAGVVSPLVQKKGLRLEIECPPNLPEVYGDRIRIRQVILNLVSNACRFTEKGSIQIKMEQTGESIITSVTDTGPGISAEDAERIFEPFCQGSEDAAWREKGGSGLGLTISKQFVEMHGGQMWLKSQPGAGSTFHFTLPVNTRSEFPAQPGRWIQPEWIWREDAFKSSRFEQAGQFARPRILVLDPAKGCANELERYSEQVDLVSVAGLADLEAHNAADQATDLVWLNAAGLPEVLSAAGELERCLPGVPIICSAILPPAEHTETSPLLRYLTKPVTIEKLQAALAVFEAPPHKILVVDDDLEVQSLFQRLLSVCLPEPVVACASSGPAALAALREDLPDLVVLDVLMPGMSGWEVLQHLRANNRTSPLPVMFVSAQDLDTRVPTSPFYLALSGTGFSVRRILDCSLVVSNLLSVDNLKPGSTHPQTAGA